MLGYQKIEDTMIDKKGGIPDSRPIEPESKKIGNSNILKWLLFLFVIVYVILSYYHAPILTHLGRYLIVEHLPQKSDLIVCLSGGNIERGLAAADAYRKGLAPLIFIAREELPEGYELLRERGIDYPQSIDMFVAILKGLGVPESAFIMSDHPVKSTIDEATVVSDLVKKRGYRSLIIITSLTHSRRAWFTYKKVFEDREVRIIMLPSRYSKFKPEDWWKQRRYKREVIIEYQKLIYYALKYLW
ncbi:MAG: YdcF family protein [Pseudomonadota bacterium]